MLRKLYDNRFEIFLSSQVAILFGSLVVPPVFFETVLEPLLFLINLSAGVVLISGSPKLMWFSIFILGLNTILFGISTTVGDEPRHLSLMRLSGYFLFYVLVTVQIIKQVWYAKRVNKNVIFGLTSGYISLGLIGFFIFLTIELVIPGSFQGGLLLNTTSTDVLTDKLMYFSFITLMTIGYGDILPVTSLAQKSTMFVGLIGQFYLVIITAVVVEKYISHNKMDRE
ncbi:ion channel [Flagellimonas sp.]|uniref:ion channel n=1 Tax=Flagellimonas sp. TaxID=2058762 RepID=UPI003F4A7315